MKDITIMAYMFFALVLLYVFGYFYKYVRKNQIEKKRDIYQQMLNHARTTRQHYVKSLGVMEDSKLRLEEQLEELRGEKARLQNTRAGLRDIMKEIRTRQMKDKPDKIDINIIQQKKVLFSQHWKVLNNFRCRFNIYLQTCRVIEKEHRKNMQLASNFCQEWEKEKGALMAMYRELKSLIPLADPRMMFSASD